MFYMLTMLSSEELTCCNAFIKQVVCVNVLNETPEDQPGAKRRRLDAASAVAASGHQSIISIMLYYIWWSSLVSSIVSYYSLV